MLMAKSPGIAYGDTLSPRRNVNAPPDSIVLETSGSCVSRNVNARIASPNPAGIRSVELAPGAINAHIRFLDPVNGEVNGSVGVEFIVEPVNPDSNASATVVITDRTSAKTELPHADSAAEHRNTLVLTYGCGQTRTVPLHAKTEVPCVNLEDLNFGTLEPGTSRTLPLTIAGCTEPVQRQHCNHGEPSPA